MRALLSIRPEFAEKILNGSKQFEFRRVIFKKCNVSKIIIYASSPVRMVIGEFEIDEILSYSKEVLWEHTQHAAGIEKHYFDKYFADKAVAYAIKVKKPIRYREPKELKIHYDVHRPPQSFLYVA
jgi:predicted transcriptional regulator